MTRGRSPFLHVLVAVLAFAGGPALQACHGAASHPPFDRTLSPGPRIAAVLTTDCGVEVDDQWALTHLLLSPEIRLLAVVTTHAATIGFSSSTSAREASEVIARVLPGLSSSAPPVLAGLDAPVGHAPESSADGVDLLLRLSRDFSPSRRLVVLVTGAATDVAAALERDPSFADRITIVGMGFDDWPSGGDVFNVRNDPAAWRAILDSDAPVAIGSSAVTQEGLRLTLQEARALMQGRGPLGDYLYSLFERWIAEQGPLVTRMVAPDTWVIWDEVVVAFALGMTRGDEVPRPRLLPDLLFAHPPTDERITWVRQIDTPRVWADFTRKIDAAARPAANGGSARSD